MYVYTLRGETLEGGFNWPIEIQSLADWMAVGTLESRFKYSASKGVWLFGWFLEKKE